MQVNIASKKKKKKKKPKSKPKKQQHNNNNKLKKAYLIESHDIEKCWKMGVCQFQVYLGI